MEDKIRQYEYAFQEIIDTIYMRAVREQDLRHAGAPLEQIQQGRIECQLSLVKIAEDAMRQKPVRLK
jgi:hypothetical protein